MAVWGVTDATFKGFGFHVAIPKVNYGSAYGITSQSITDERRLQISEKPLVDGAEVEDFGRKPRNFTAEVIFFGTAYLEDLKKFEAVLNEGTTGILILPDLIDAVNAKFKSSSRRTTATDGNSTVITVNWVEDISKTVLTNPLRVAIQAQDDVQAQNFKKAQPTVLSLAAQIQKQAADTAAKLKDNPVLKAIQTAENAVTTARVTINSVLNVPKNARQDIISTVGRINSELSGLSASLSGILTLFDDLTQNKNTPTRFNTGLGQVDFQTIDLLTASVVQGSVQVVTTTKKTVQVTSIPDAVKKLQGSATNIVSGKAVLEKQTLGSTSSFSASSVQLVGLITDLISVLQEKPSINVITTSKTSLMEVCFANGLGVTNVDRIHAKNTFLYDILDVPAFTVISI